MVVCEQDAPVDQEEFEKMKEQRVVIAKQVESMVNKRMKMIERMLAEDRSDIDISRMSSRQICCVVALVVF